MRPSGLRPKCSGVRVSPVKRSTVTRSNGMLELPQQNPRLHAVPRSGMVVQDHARNLACRVCGEEWQPRPRLLAGLVGGAATAHAVEVEPGVDWTTIVRHAARRADQRPDGRPRRVRGVLSNERIARRERVSAMARRVRAVAGVNGGFFAPERRPGRRARDRRRAPERARGRPLRAAAAGGRLAPRRSRRSVTGDASTVNGRSREIDGIDRTRGLIPACGGRGGDVPTIRPNARAHLHRLQRARGALAPLRRPAARRGRRGGHRP